MCWWFICPHPWLLVTMSIHGRRVKVLTQQLVASTEDVDLDNLAYGFMASSALFAALELLADLRLDCFFCWQGATFFYRQKMVWFFGRLEKTSSSSSRNYNFWILEHEVLQPLPVPKLLGAGWVSSMPCRRRSSPLRSWQPPARCHRTACRRCWPPWWPPAVCGWRRGLGGWVTGTRPTCRNSWCPRPKRTTETIWNIRLEDCSMVGWESWFRFWEERNTWTTPAGFPIHLWLQPTHKLSTMAALPRPRPFSNVSLWRASGRCWMWAVAVVHFPFKPCAWETRNWSQLCWSCQRSVRKVKVWCLHRPQSRRLACERWFRVGWNDVECHECLLTITSYVENHGRSVHCLLLHSKDWRCIERQPMVAQDHRPCRPASWFQGPLLW